MKHLFSIWMISLFLVSVTSCKNGEDGTGLLPIAEKALGDTSSVYYAHIELYPEDISMLPIGLYDSSPAGLSVVEKFLTIDRFDNITGKRVPDGIPDFGGEKFQFFADNANGPFYSYLEANNKDYLRSQLIMDAMFLMGSSYYNISVDDYQSGQKEPVKAVVMISNISDAVGRSDLEKTVSCCGKDIVVVGVIDAGIAASFEGITPIEDYCIGILGSAGDLTSRDYEHLVRQKASEYGLTGAVQIFYQNGMGLRESIRGDKEFFDPSADSFTEWYGGPKYGISYNDIDYTLMDRYNFETSDGALFVGQGEDGGRRIQLNSVGNYIRYHIVSMVERHRRSGSKIPLSSVILTDYRYSEYKELMNSVIEELYNYKRDGMYLYRSSISESFRFIDPVEYAAMECYMKLRKNDNLAYRSVDSDLRAFISVPAPGLPGTAYSTDSERVDFNDIFRTHRMPNTENITSKAVPFAQRYVDDTTMSFIEFSLPHTYKKLRNTLY